MKIKNVVKKKKKLQKRLDGLQPISPALSHNIMYCIMTGQGHSWAGRSQGATI